jgi:hypothetical protein
MSIKIWIQYKGSFIWFNALKKIKYTLNISMIIYLIVKPYKGINTLDLLVYKICIDIHPLAKHNFNRTPNNNILLNWGIEF